MVTGASTADLSVILADARKGVLTQTRRHSYLVSLLGIRHVVLVVNKMDLVAYSQSVFAGIEKEYRAFAEQLGLPAITCIPISAINGDNILQPSASTPWYEGQTLMNLLDNVEIDETRLNEQPLRLPVQWVNRPNHDFRGFAGTIVAGRLRKGDAVRVQPSGRTSRVARVVTFDGELEEASVGQSITITLDDEIDISRGDVLASEPPHVGKGFEAELVWMDERPLDPARVYLVKQGTRTVTAEVSHGMVLNQIGTVVVSTAQPIAFDRYAENRATGSFILVDPGTHFTCGAGLITDAVRETATPHAAAPLSFAERIAQMARRASSDEEAAEAVRKALEDMLT
jgi:bifunctional enzyme CysN/CysC